MSSVLKDIYKWKKKAGESPLPHREMLDIIRMTVSTCVVGRGGSGLSSPTLVKPTNGRICPGPMSIGTLLGNEIILLAGSSGAMWSCLCHFHDDLLRDVSSAISESNAGSHLWNLQVIGDQCCSGDALCFPFNSSAKRLQSCKYIPELTRVW